MIYTSPKGYRFEFNGWEPGESPVECFDNKKWIACAHGCMLAMILIGDAQYSHEAIADDGILHELLHLSEGIDICDCNELSVLRETVVGLQETAIGMLLETGLVVEEPRIADDPVIMAIRNYHKNRR